MLKSVKKINLKVPKLTVFFWIIKLLTTAMGEAISDYLNLQLGPAIAVPIMLFFLALALKLQFKQTKYNPWTYWFVVVMVSVFGTTAADALHVVIGIPYVLSSSIYLVVMIGLFIYWYKREGTLSIHSIYSRSRETLYWATVLAAFALGTASGDMTATSFHMGFLDSGLMFSIIFILPAIAYFYFGLNPIIAFWLSYIMTRPMGASFADWFDASKSVGGIGVSTWGVGVSLMALIVIFVTYLAKTRVDVPDTITEL